MGSSTVSPCFRKARARAGAAFVVPCRRPVYTPRCLATAMPAAWRSLACWSSISAIPKRRLPSNFPRLEHRGHPAIDVFYVDKLIAKGLGFALQMRQHPIPILWFIRLLARVHGGRTIPQPTVDQPGQLGRSRRHRFGCPEPGPPPTLRGPQGSGTVGDAWGRQPPGRRRPVRRWCAPPPGACAP